MIEIITHEGAIALDLSPDTTIPVTENSKGFDSNNFAFDFTSNVNLPYSSSNVKALHKFGMEQFKVILKSDGVFIADYYARIVENKLNLNTYTGTLTLELNSLFKDLNETLTNTRLKQAFQYNETLNTLEVSEEDLLDENEPLFHAKLRLMQANVGLDKPYRFPEYHLVKDVVGENKEPFLPVFGDTVGPDFGNIVNVNHLNNTYQTPPPIPPKNIVPWSIQSPEDDWDIRYLIQYDRGGYMHIDRSFPSAGSPTGSQTFKYNFQREARRLWGLVCPCFSYLYVLEKALESIGLKVNFDWNNADVQAFFENLVILNNYNIYNVNIVRTEGKFTWYANNSNSMISGFELYESPYVGPSIVTHPIGEAIVGSNHVPDISLLDLMLDFKAKTNFILEVVNDTIHFKNIQVRPSEVRFEFNPNIEVIKNENLLRILHYEYESSDNPDNVPDYRVANLQKDSEEINSNIVPVYVKTLLENVGTGQKSFFPYIVAKPSIDRDKSWAKTNYFKDVAYLLEYTFSSVADEARASDELNSYAIQSCPMFCANVLYFDNILINLYHRYYPRPTGFFFYYACIADESFYDLGTMKGSLRWDGEKGIFESMYKGSIDILKAKFVVKLKAAMTIEAWNKFSHYHFFSLTGKKLFPLLREYTLPFSKNNQVKMDCYEVE